MSEILPLFQEDLVLLVVRQNPEAPVDGIYQFCKLERN